MKRSPVNNELWQGRRFLYLSEENTIMVERKLFGKRYIILQPSLLLRTDRAVWLPQLKGR